MIINPVPVWVYILSPALILLLKMFGWFYRKVKGKRLVVLGMKEAGKTRFYRFLQNKPYVEEESEVDNYEEFVYKKKNGETVLIKKGIDIGGSEDYVKPHYERMIAENDILIFCFDISKYLIDMAYMKQVNYRFEFISRKYKELKKDKYNFVKLATHVDKTPNPKEAFKKFNSMIEKKEYKIDFKKNLFLVDVTNKDELQKIVDKIF
jgi:GTPase SAR1 family protein